MAAYQRPGLRQRGFDSAVHKNGRRAIASYNTGDMPSQEVVRIIEDSLYDTEATEGADERPEPNHVVGLFLWRMASVTDPASEPNWATIKWMSKMLLRLVFGRH